MLLIMGKNPLVQDNGSWGLRPCPHATLLESPNQPHALPNNDKPTWAHVTCNASCSKGLDLFSGTQKLHLSRVMD
jgi:hypothetical protein